jgi:peptidoglycan/xylan/chitin deacetylase (PgdA/CDA1 family)
VVSLDDVAASLRGERGLPDRPAVITIDDGYRSIASLAFPILEEYGTPASVFVCTDFIDGRPLWNDRIEYAIIHSTSERIRIEIAGRSHVLNLALPAGVRECVITLIESVKRVPQEARDLYIEELERVTGARLELGRNTNPDYQPMSWDDVRRLADSPLISIGCHTKTGAILSRCTDETLRAELAASKQTIEKYVEQPCTLFSYPNGGIGDFDERTSVALIEAGFDCGLTAVAGLNDARSDVMALRRYFTGPDVAALEVRMSGFREVLRNRTFSPR